MHSTGTTADCRECTKDMHRMRPAHSDFGELSRAAFGIRHSAFSLAELLIVIAIIVLALSLAVPALNLLTGAKSTEQAQNVVSVMLAQARNEAIGIQEYRGIMFYLDPTDDRVKVAMVEQVDPPDSPLENVDVYLDMIPGRDVMGFPKGVLVQVVDDAGGSQPPGPSIPRNDKYLGFNKRNNNTKNGACDPTLFAYGGVILFDGRGLLVSKCYALATHRLNPITNVQEYTPMGVLLYGVDPTDSYQNSKNDIVPVNPEDNTNINQGRLIRSQFGFSLFDSEEFKNASGNDEDLQVTGGGYVGSSEEAEETWLDNNAVPILINRYNGSLIKGQ